MVSIIDYSTVSYNISIKLLIQLYLENVYVDNQLLDHCRITIDNVTMVFIQLSTLNRGSTMAGLYILLPWLGSPCCNPHALQCVPLSDV